MIIIIITSYFFSDIAPDYRLKKKEPQALVPDLPVSVKCESPSQQVKQDNR